MTADVELLEILRDIAAGRRNSAGDYWSRDYCDKAAAKIEALQMEIEALRAEVKDYRTNGAAAVRFAPSSAHWSKELRRLFGDDARTGIEVLENRHRQELARAERLAEALRDAAVVLDVAGLPGNAKHFRAALLPTAAQEKQQ